MKLNNLEIERLAEQSGFQSFEIGVFEGDHKAFRNLIKLVLDKQDEYEEYDPIADKNANERYGFY